MHAAIVETAVETAGLRIVRYSVLHDCGTLINPRIVEGQIHGEVVQVFASAIEDAEGLPVRAMPISPSELFALRAQHSR